MVCGAYILRPLASTVVSVMANFRYEKFVPSTFKLSLAFNSYLKQYIYMYYIEFC